MFTCSRCKTEKRGNPIVILFLMRNGHELTEGYLPEYLLNSVGDDLCAQCARELRGMMLQAAVPKEGRKNRRGKVSIYDEKDDAAMLKAYRDGLNQREIAEIYKVSQGTVSTHIRQAVAREQKSGS